MSMLSAAGRSHLRSVYKLMRTRSRIRPHAVHPAFARGEARLDDSSSRVRMIEEELPDQSAKKRGDIASFVERRRGVQPATHWTAVVEWS